MDLNEHENRSCVCLSGTVFSLNIKPESEYSINSFKEFWYYHLDNTKTWWVLESDFLFKSDCPTSIFFV